VTSLLSALNWVIINKCRGRLVWTGSQSKEPGPKVYIYILSVVWIARKEIDYWCAGEER